MKGYSVEFNGVQVAQNLLTVSDALIYIATRIGQGHRNHPHVVSSEYGRCFEMHAEEIEAMR